MSNMKVATSHEIEDFIRSQIDMIQSELKQRYDLDINITNFTPNYAPRITFNIDDIDENHLLKKKNLNDLKDICKQYGLRYSGKKDHLLITLGY